jgi:CSLREA domain-containing protein
MNPRLPNLSLSLLLAALAPVAATAARPGARPAAAPRAAQVFGYLFTVNTTGDADRVASGPNCDTDASTPGDQCTLRSAIQAANANPSEAGIDIIIPPTDPGCDAATGRCTITIAGRSPS